MKDNDVTQDTQAGPAAAPPQVPPRPQQQPVDPIIDALKSAARPQLQQGFPIEEHRPQPKYQATPLLPPHMLQQPQQQQGVQFPQQLVYDGAMGSLMSAMLNQQRDVNTKFYMLLVPESAAPVVQLFDTIEELKLAIKPQLGTSTYIFCFLGHALRITKGPFHFLQTPYGAVPLHDIPTANDQESLSDGWVGPELPITEFVRQSVSVDELPEDTIDDEDDGVDFDEAEADDDVPQDETQLF